jgi:hypothetical protein
MDKLLHPLMSSLSSPLPSLLSPDDIVVDDAIARVAKAAISLQVIAA